MANRGGQPGNKNAAGKQVWRDAIRKALAKDKQALERVATKLIEEAQNGDMAAIKELGDRLDGKPKQSIEGDVKGELTVEIVRFAHSTPE